jgi:hypothetical protein
MKDKIEFQKEKQMSPKAGWYLNVENNKMKYWDGDNWKKRDEDETPVAPSFHRETSHKAIIAFVLAFIFPVVGWVLGIRANREIRNSNGRKHGASFATAATWIGGLITAFWIVIFSLTMCFGSHHHHDRFGGHNNFGRGMMGGYSRSLGSNQNPQGGNNSWGMMGSHSFGSQGLGSQGLGSQGFGMMGGNSRLGNSQLGSGQSGQSNGTQRGFGFMRSYSGQSGSGQNAPSITPQK